MIGITFLGTSGSTPTKDRALPSVAVEYDGETYLFDCGEGTQRQFLNYGLNISKVNYVFLTHIHGDHVIGLAGLMRTLSTNNRTRPLHVFIPEGDEEKIRALMTFDRAFIRYPVVIKGIRGGTVLRNNGVTVTAFRLTHSVRAYGFVFKQDDRLRFDKEKSKRLGIKGEMFSRLQRRKSMRIDGRTVTLRSVTTPQAGRKITYVTDTRPSKAIVAAAKGSDLLIHEATFERSLKHYAVERKHSTSEEAATVARQSRSKELILFHISARYKDTATILNEARHIFSNTRIAYDGMKVSL